MKFIIGDRIQANNGAYTGTILGRVESGQYHVYWDDKQSDAIHTQDFIESFHDRFND